MKYSSTVISPASITWWQRWESKHSTNGLAPLDKRSAAEAGQKTKVFDGSQHLTPPTMQEIHHDQTEHGRTTL